MIRQKWSGSAARSWPPHWKPRRDRDVLLEPGTFVFQPGAGAPHATDLERGRRPGTGQDFHELV